MHFTAIKFKWEPKDFLFYWWCQAARGWTQTHTHTHLYDPEWHISPDRWHHTLPWLVGTSPFNLNIQLLRNLSLSLSLTPYGQSQGALFWDRWPMATTLTQSRVKPRNKTGRLVWFGPIRAFRVRRKCKEENERGYGLGKVKKTSLTELPLVRSFTSNSAQQLFISTPS